MLTGSRGSGSKESEDKMYRYYLTKRQAMPGAIPTAGLKTVKNYDDRMYCEEIQREVWAYVEYEKLVPDDVIKKYEMIDLPDNYVTGEKVVTPRGSFELVNLELEKIQDMEYGVHHMSDDGKFYIVSNGKRGFAVKAE